MSDSQSPDLRIACILTCKRACALACPLGHIDRVDGDSSQGTYIIKDGRRIDEPFMIWIYSISPDRLKCYWYGGAWVDPKGGMFFATSPSGVHVGVVKVCPPTTSTDKATGVLTERGVAPKQEVISLGHFSFPSFFFSNSLPRAPSLDPYHNLAARSTVKQFGNVPIWVYFSDVMRRRNCPLLSEVLVGAIITHVHCYVPATDRPEQLAQIIYSVLDLMTKTPDLSPIPIPFVIQSEEKAPTPSTQSTLFRSAEDVLGASKPAANDTKSTDLAGVNATKKIAESTSRTLVKTDVWTHPLSRPSRQPPHGDCEDMAWLALDLFMELSQRFAPRVPLIEQYCPFAFDTIVDGPGGINSSASDDIIIVNTDKSEPVDAIDPSFGTAPPKKKNLRMHIVACLVPWHLILKYWLFSPDLKQKAIDHLKGVELLQNLPVLLIEPTLWRIGGSAKDAKIAKFQEKVFNILTRKGDRSQVDQLIDFPVPFEAKTDQAYYQRFVSAYSPVLTQVCRVTGFTLTNGKDLGCSYAELMDPKAVKAVRMFPKSETKLTDAHMAIVDDFFRVGHLPTDTLSLGCRTPGAYAGTKDIAAYLPLVYPLTIPQQNLTKLVQAGEFATVSSIQVRDAISRNWPDLQVVLIRMEKQLCILEPVRRVYLTIKKSEAT